MADTDDVREMRARLRAAAAALNTEAQDHRARRDPGYLSRAGKLGAARCKELIERGKALEAAENAKKAAD